MVRLFIMRGAAIRLLTAACFLLVGSSASAQSVNGSIQGTVVDQSGGSLPGVMVTVTNTSTGVARTTTTDQTGGAQY